MEQSFLNTNFSSIKSGNINAAFGVNTDVSIISQKLQVLSNFYLVQIL